MHSYVSVLLDEAFHSFLYDMFPGKEYKYRATFRTETLSQILDYLARSADLKWKIEEPQQQADDTLSKTKIRVDLY